MPSVFIQLSVVLGLSAILGFVMQKLRLPLVVAYLLTGVLIASTNFIDHNAINIFTFLPDIGIAFVLFLIGMELDFGQLKSLGKPIVITSLSQIIISSIAGFTIAGFFGFSIIQSFYIGIGLSFSSTLVVVKLLLERKTLSSLYGKLSLGMLLIEDLVAVVVLMLLSLGSAIFSPTGSTLGIILLLLLKASGLFLLAFLAAKFVLSKILNSVARSPELLFLTALTWCFLFTSLAVVLNFSVVIGAFLAGIALASSPYNLHIEGKMKPLRDFFVALFFVYLGSQAKLTDLVVAAPAVVVFTSYALIIKPLIYLLMLGVFGFKKHTLFHTAINLSQVSEFSLIILLVAVNSHIVPNLSLSIMATVAVFSIITSTIMISLSKKIYPQVFRFLSFFEHTTKTHFFEIKDIELLEGHVVVIGGHGFGASVLSFLKKNSIPFIALDIDPHIVENWRSRGVKVLYGDISDPEILDSLQLQNAKLIVLNTQELLENELLLNEVKRKHFKSKVIVRAQDNEQAELLKQWGADFVILPERVTGEVLVEKIKQFWPHAKFE